MATMPTRRVNEPTESPVYKSVLIAMMSYRDGIEYSKSYEFSPEELGEVTPEDVYKWMAMKVYGRPDPNNDDNPTHGRSSSLEYYKKALSYFMPNRLSTWNAIMHSGNPTRSVPVNNLIKAVKKKEVRRQGKPSQARRPLARIPRVLPYNAYPSFIQGQYPSVSVACTVCLSIPHGRPN